MAGPMTDGIVVARDISPNDEMFDRNESHYFGVGQSALACIRTSLDAAQVQPGDVKRILDLPCGHGRVLRYLRAAFPEAEIVACDLLRDGVDFCARTFGAIPVYSHEDPARIPIADAAFDLIWVGSLLTHLDSGRWAGFFEAFRRGLRPGGVLVFTTAGRVSHDWIARAVRDYGLSSAGTNAVRYGFERTGFGYANYPQASAWGMAVTSPSWVLRQITRIPEMRVVHFAERAWDNHQDVLACVRDPAWQVLHPPISVWTLLKHRLRGRAGARG